MIAKDPEYRNRKLLDLAHKLTDCQLQLPGICAMYSEHGCEPAHANNWHPVYGKGGARKAHDIYHCAACHNCHAALDQGKDLSNKDRQFYWDIGFKRTMLEYLRRGWLKVAA